MQQTRTAGLVVIVLSIALSGGLYGQTPVAGAGADAGQIVALAEAEGAGHTRLPQPENLGSSFRRPVEGTTERRCVEGHDRGPVRSGEFVIGGQLGGALGATSGRAAKIWWAPLHSAASMPSLSVRARNLTAPADTFVFARGSGAFVTPPGAGREYFFPSGITFPSAGRWLLVASSGANWGCIIVTVR